MLRTTLVRYSRNHLARHPYLNRMLRRLDSVSKLARHTAASVVPSVIRPAPERLTVAITALCNLRCIGCRYGRDYMPNQQLTSEAVYGLLSDAAAVGFPTVRLYGGEPLLHPQLPRFVEYAIGVSVKPVITTNGILLEKKAEELYNAGLRSMSIGYYGYADHYDQYVDRKGAFSRLERSIAAVRDKYGMDVDIQINYLLTRQTCAADLLNQAWQFARRYRLFLQVDLVHYSLPYFSEGPNHELQFTPSDRANLLRVVQRLSEIKAEAPDLFPESAESIRSIPDWALKGPAMQVPCDAYKMLWVGADGSVRLCYAAFPLGNIYQTPLRQLFGAPEHRDACGKAFKLECPHCHCERGSRIDSHLPSRFRYRGATGGQPLPPAVPSGNIPGPLPILQ